MNAVIQNQSTRRTVRLSSIAAAFFDVSETQLFQLDQDTTFFAGDLVLVKADGRELAARALPKGFLTLAGRLTRRQCKVVGLMVPSL